jgi:hypothetical protein
MICSHDCIIKIISFLITSIDYVIMIIIFKSDSDFWFVRKKDCQSSL